MKRWHEMTTYKPMHRRIDWWTKLFRSIKWPNEAIAISLARSSLSRALHLESLHCDRDAFVVRFVTFLSMSDISPDVSRSNEEDGCRFHQKKTCYSSKCKTNNLANAHLPVPRKTLMPRYTLLQAEWKAFPCMSKLFRFSFSLFSDSPSDGVS